MQRISIRESSVAWRRRAVLTGLATLTAAVAPSLPTVPVALAHQPEANPGSPDVIAPYLVPKATVSRAIRGVVPAGSVDYYALEMDAHEALVLWLLTPAADACEGFAPIMRIHDGFHDPDVVRPWDGTTWFAGRTVTRREPSSWVVEANPWGWFAHAGERAYSGPYVRVAVGPGTLLVSIEATPDSGGAYTFAPGHLEIPGGGVTASTMSRWRTCPATWEP